MLTYPNKIRSKLPNVGTTIFTVISRLAAEHGAINLGQGFPDFNCPQRLTDLVMQHMRAGDNQYAPMAGAVQLREAIARKVEALYGCKYDPEHEITVTAGGTQAIFTAITAVVRAGDEVIVIEPAYDSYVPSITLAGGVPVFAQLTYPGYRIDWKQIERLITPKTRMIIINTPHNPTATVLGPDDMRELQRLTAGTDIIILSDEVYEHIIFDGRRHESMSRYPDLAARSFVVSSFGKTYHVTGWKVGHVLAPQALMTEFRRVHQFNVFTVNTPVQLALADFIVEAPAHYLELGAFYQQKRDFFRAALAQSKFRLLPSEGSYFQMAEYKDISDKTDVNFCRWLTTTVGVAAIPPSVFYDQPAYNPVIRFCFAKSEETMTKAATILCKL